MTFPPMRPQIEIQRVHDMLNTVLSDQGLARALVPREMIGPLVMAADCLCWILHHDTRDQPDSHAVRFGQIVGILRASLDEAGYGSEPPDAPYVVEVE